MERMEAENEETMNYLCLIKLESFVSIFRKFVEM